MANEKIDKTISELCGRIIMNSRPEKQDRVVELLDQLCVTLLGEPEVVLTAADPFLRKLVKPNTVLTIEYGDGPVSIDDDCGRVQGDTLCEAYKQTQTGTE